MLSRLIMPFERSTTWIRLTFLSLWNETVSSCQSCHTAIQVRRTSTDGHIALLLQIRSGRVNDGDIILFVSEYLRS